jgi:hypothetical protein
LRPRRLVPILAAVVVLAACADDPSAAPEAPTIDAPDPDAGDADLRSDDEQPDDEQPGDGPTAMEDQALQLELPDVEDGVIRTEGVVVPVPDGWTLDETAFSQGVIGISPDTGADGEVPSQLLIASGAIGSNPVFGVQGLGYEDILELYGSLLPGGPDLDEDVEVDGSDRARLLRYNDIAVQEGQDPTDEVLLVVDAGDGRVALFNYAAPSDEFDEDVLQLLLAEAGIDPDSEPTELAPSDGPDDG